MKTSCIQQLRVHSPLHSLNISKVSYIDHSMSIHNPHNSRLGVSSYTAAESSHFSLYDSEWFWLCNKCWCLFWLEIFYSFLWNTRHVTKAISNQWQMTIVLSKHDRASLPIRNKSPNKLYLK